MNWRKALRWLASRPLERLRDRRFQEAQRAYNRAHESPLVRALRESQERHVREWGLPRFGGLESRPRTLEWRKTGPLTMTGTPEYTRADFVLSSPGGEEMVNVITDIEFEKMAQEARREVAP